MSIYLSAYVYNGWRKERLLIRRFPSPVDFTRPYPENGSRNTANVRCLGVVLIERSAGGFE